MRQVSIEAFEPESDTAAIVAVLAGNTFPFHRSSRVSSASRFSAFGLGEGGPLPRAWPVEDGEPLASIAYGMLRRDWETGTTTPVPWQDLPA